MLKGTLMATDDKQQIAFEFMERLSRIAQVFSPGAPIDKYDLFAGRRDQVTDVLNAVNQRGQHVALFGERGVGKTSLANIIAEVVHKFGTQPRDAIAVNCDSDESFQSLCRKVFRELAPMVRDRGVAGFNGQDDVYTQAESPLPENASPEDVRFALENLNEPAILILDEFDRIKDPATAGMIADTIKTLSDHSSRATVMIVGVADSVDGLIGGHRSIERCLVQVRVPRMSPPELVQVIENGLTIVGMTIDPRAEDEIVTLSQGLAHYTHLLSLHAAQSATTNGRSNITQADVTAAINKAVEKAQQSIVSAYHAATSSPRPDSLFEDVLLACAMAKTDELGYFAAADVRDPLSKIKGKRYEIPAYSRHLNDFSSDRGPVLQKTGSRRRYRFRFVSPLMQPYVLMRGRATDRL